MPGKYTIKPDIDNGIYHVFNRGVEKRPIFLDSMDEGVFLSYLQTYLLPKDEKQLRQFLTDPSVSSKQKDRILRELQLNNFAKKITLLAYCLMPNHFHFLLEQKQAGFMEEFIRSLSVRYVMYFNKKYRRLGGLFQGVYRGVLVERDDYFLHLTRYIHQQARGRPSSYGDYLGLTKTAWVHPERILELLRTAYPGTSYAQFMGEPKDFSFIQPFLLDDD
ncbi:MAG: transposase [bacterium]|nr:transposase [bacterium]